MDNHFLTITLIYNHNITKMKLEDEIKQKKPFANQSAKLIVNVMYTSAWVSDNLKTQLKPYGITLKQYNILRILYGAEKPLTSSEIRDRMIDKMSDVTRLMDRMTIKGLAKRKTRSKDKRLVDITISQTGIELIKQISAQSPLEDFAKTLGDKDTEQLNLLLDQLRNK